MKPKHIITLLFFLLSNTAFTPAQMYDEQGNLTWEADLDIYGKVRNFAGRSLNECPFRFQGQYEDAETGLAYNRFRYYDPDSGNYISQDPIRLAGNNPTFYGYVKDPNSWIDPFGLDDLYALIATQDGWYPVMEWGKKESVGDVFLKEGEVWKIGTSKNADTRYPKSYLKNIGDGVDVEVLKTDLPDRTVKSMENSILKEYKANGGLPAGNKCCH